MKSLRGKGAVITGGARGIGRCIAVALAREGAHIALADIHAEQLESTAEEIRALGVRASTHVVNVADRAQLLRLRDEAIAAHGEIHILVNNAGITRYGSVLESNEADIDAQMTINFMGTVYGTRAFLPHLLEQNDAHIINLSSMAAITGIPMQATYSASKAAIRAFSQALSAELSATHVNVTWLMPGAIRTELLDHVGDIDKGVTSKLSSLLKSYAYKPEWLAAKLVKHIQRTHGELRITPECEVLYQVNRLSPSLVRGSMRSVQKLASSQKH